MNEEMKHFLDVFNKNADAELFAENFTIKDNLLKFQNGTVQISNISQIFAGQNQLRLPKGAAITALISLGIFFPAEYTTFKVIGGFFLLITVAIIYFAYQKYFAAKYLLRFHMNSGNIYTVPFKDQSFLIEVRKIVEASILKGNLDYTVNVGDKIVMHGNNHVVKGDNNNLNTGIQKDVQVHSNNEIDNSNFSMNVSGSQIQGANFGSNNALTTEGEVFDWRMLEVEFQKVLDQIKIDTPIKKMSEEALVLIKEKDESQFKTFIRKYKPIFSSDFFKNTASGLLVQWLSKMSGIV